MERIDREVLKRVSRSFYLSLKWLPAPMREPISLAYLLARASDTLADAEAAPTGQRLQLLDGFAAEVAGGAADWRRGEGLAAFAAAVDHEGERELLRRLPQCFEALDGSPNRERIRETIGIIVSGQRLDLVRFAAATAEEPVALASDEELEDYCYRVAGCVGAFWTMIGNDMLGNDFSKAPEGLKEKGITYGKALQLVNILRDVPKDLSQGRRYLPGPDLAESHARWLAVAERWLEAGTEYAARLESRRLRMATALPALLGQDTLALLKAAGSPPRERLKIPRSLVRRALWRAFWLPTSNR